MASITLDQTSSSADGNLCPVPEGTMVASRRASAPLQTSSAHNATSALLFELPENPYRRRFEKMRQSVNAMGRLEANWNTYGAESPNEGACRTAKRVLTLLEEVQIAPDRVAASAENGIDIIFSRHHRFADIECFNDGDIVALISSGNGEPVAWDVERNDDDILATVRRIRGFVQTGDDPEADVAGD